MIYTDRQYRVSLDQLAILERALDEAKARNVDQAWLKETEANALKSQIEEIRAEIAQYDLLKSGEFPFTKTHSLEQLPSVLVQARIAAGMSQTDLAASLALKPQQVQRYEASGYMGASLARLIEVARALGVKASGAVEDASGRGSAIFVWNNQEDVAWSQFPFKEMIRRKWFDVPHGGNPIAAVRDYFLNAAGAEFATALHRKKMRSGSVPNEFSLLAWQARIVERARRRVRSGEVAPFELDDRWLSDLRALTRRKDGPKRAFDLLGKHGIILVVEPHLPGSYLDGAAMLVDSGQPIIGLTLRYDRLDNFWFVLFHELGHVFLHLFDGMRFDFFDEESAITTDSVEQEADNFALDTLIPGKLWEQCLARFALSEEAVQIDADSLGIDPSIIAGRIRKERGNYTILNSLVGQGLVRSQLREANDETD